MAQTLSVGAQASRLARDLPLAGSSSVIPKLVYGTAWKKERTADLVYAALKAGFRALDTAAQPKHYDERGAGEGVRRAVAQGIVDRAQLFVQTKFTSPAGQNETTPYDLDASLVDKVHQSVRSSLAHFTLDGEDPYLDCLVLHSPMETMEETVTVWRTLESYTPHKIRNLGLSNTTLAILQQLHGTVARKPAVVQNRFYDGTGYEVPLRSFCRDENIVFQSFWTIGANPSLARSEPVRQVAAKAAVEAVAAYYSLVLGLGGVTILDGTTDEVHMKDDLDGVRTVASWAEADGVADWEAALKKFKSIVGDACV
ncbi:aldo-keto reductase [Drechmeria coniospora]|uniref:Aldo-keto reductase n=1 Tax=Drechmeria coniospora TaxID=98403 RepID=A0A151GF25_DRECN|nr:aldo-keto reductase [Drechmeria coniospora]KYK55694.1 aldo-keto reductase [Drechmeria coniospora]ODA81704.1 hypothetical protein RJ55_00206 [Drechmeria coniospora]